MASEVDNTGSGAIDFAYLLAAVVAEAGGEVSITTDWFTAEENPFEGHGFNIREESGRIHIELAEEEK